MPLFYMGNWAQSPILSISDRHGMPFGQPIPEAAVIAEKGRRSRERRLSLRTSTFHEILRLR